VRAAQVGNHAEIKEKSIFSTSVDNSGIFTAFGSYLSSMRWERLFQDLEDQLDREADAELEDIARDEERLRIARLPLIERVREFQGQPGSAPVLSISVSQLVLDCTVIRCGRDWMLVQVHGPAALAGTALMPVAAMKSVRIHALGVSQVTRPKSGEASVRPGALSSDIAFSFVLRDLCRRRRHVTLRCDFDEISGTIERVGKDHLDIAIHSAGLPRTADAVSHFEIVPLARIDLVQLT